MSEYIVTKIHLTDEVAKLTYKDENFNPRKWSWLDVEILRKAANFIERELKEIESK